MNNNSTLEKTKQSVIGSLIELSGIFRNTYADNAVWANQLDELVLDGSVGVTLAIGLEVTKVTNMTLLVGWSTVGLGVWVD